MVSSMVMVIFLQIRLTVQKPESFYSAWGPQEVQPSFGRATAQEEQKEVKSLAYFHEIFVNVQL